MTRPDFQRWVSEVLVACAPDLLFSRMIDDLRNPRFTAGVEVHDPNIKEFVRAIADAAKSFEQAHATLYGYLLQKYTTAS